MTAFDELRASAPGVLFWQMLVEVTRQLVRTGPFPPPHGHPRWTREDVEELAADFLTGASSTRADDDPAEQEMRKLSRSKARLAKLTTVPHDEQSLRGYTFKALNKYLIDEAKATPKGKLRRRLETLLEGDTRFTEVPGADPRSGRWHLVGSSPEAYGGDLPRLSAAANSVRGRLDEPLNSAGPTPAPSKALVISVLHAILSEAAGSVPVGDLTTLLAQRLNLAGLERDQSLDDLRAGQLDAGTSAPRTPDEYASLEYAEQLFEQMSPAQRQLLPFVGMPDEAPGLLGLGAASVHAGIEKLTAHLRLATEDDEDNVATVRELQRLCCTFCPRRAQLRGADCGCGLWSGAA